jgi:hypothetical protein
MDFSPTDTIPGTRVSIKPVNSTAIASEDIEKAKAELRAIIDEALKVGFVVYAAHRLHVYEDWGHDFEKWDAVWRSFSVFESLCSWTEEDINSLALAFASTNDRHDQSYYFSYPVFRAYLIQKNEAFNQLLPKPGARHYDDGRTQQPIP